VGSSTQRTLPPENAFSASCPARPSLKTDLCYAEVVVPPQVPVARIIVGGAAALLIDRDCILSHDRRTLRVLQELVQGAFAGLTGFFPGSELNARLFHGKARHGPEFPTVPV
jgi:hypothetical protein